MPIKSTDVNVFETKDYGQFKILDGNRPLKKYHLKILETSILKKDLKIPIVVNEKYQIIDGQHRLEILKKHKLPVTFMIKKGFGLDEVHQLNTNRKNWSNTEFMHSYANMGKEEYIRYREFWNKYQFEHTLTIAMLSDSINAGGTALDQFKDGIFVIKDWNGGCKKAENILRIREFFPDGYKKRPFVLAMLRLFTHKDFDYSEFIGKMKLRGDQLIDVSSINSYLRIIEKIYNWKRRQPVNFFWDLKVKG